MEHTTSFAGNHTAVRETSITLRFAPEQSTRSCTTLVRQVEQARRAGYDTIMINMSGVADLQPDSLKVLRLIGNLAQNNGRARAGRRRGWQPATRQPQTLIMLLNPSPEVKQTLHDNGIDTLTDVYSDL